MPRIYESKSVDKEWIELLKEAKNLGIPLEEVRIFLSTKKEKKQN